jgi:hypothetical protein
MNGCGTEITSCLTAKYGLFGRDHAYSATSSQFIEDSFVIKIAISSHDTCLNKFIGAYEDTDSSKEIVLISGCFQGVQKNINPQTHSLEFQFVPAFCKRLMHRPATNFNTILDTATNLKFNSKHPVACKQPIFCCIANSGVIPTCVLFSHKIFFHTQFTLPGKQAKEPEYQDQMQFITK